MARKLDALEGLLAEKPAPAPGRRPAARTARTVPVVTPKPQAPTRDAIEADIDAETTVRSTLDLAASRHAVLLREAADAGLDVGWPVRPQHLLRAMFDELVDDPAVMARVRDRIRNQGRPVRRRTT